MKCIVNDDMVLSQPLDGPLSAQIPAFAQWARDQGYAWASRYRQVLLAACFSRWLGQQAITIRRVSTEHVTRYLRSRARRAQIHRGDTAALCHFVDFLRHDGVIRSKKVAPPLPSPVDLRAFLHYVRSRGDITQDLVAAVPSVAQWSMPSIPRAIPAASVRQLLASINRQTARGRRDYAILLLLARLGLRASEVAFLELDDLDWEGGQVTVRGKHGPGAHSLYRLTSARRLPRTSGMDDPAVPADVCSCGRMPRSAVLPGRVPSPASSETPSSERASMLRPRARINSATVWRRRCCGAEPR